MLPTRYAPDPAPPPRPPPSPDAVPPRVLYSRRPPPLHRRDPAAGYLPTLPPDLSCPPNNSSYPLATQAPTIPTQKPILDPRLRGGLGGYMHVELHAILY